MDTQSFGSVVAMEFRRRPSIAFADIVEEFDIAFQVVDSRTRALTWDCDDIALIDRDGVRVALGWLPGGEQGQPWHLVVAVGAAPGAGKDKIDPASFRFIADRIVERSRDYLPVNAVLHGEASQPVGAELVDTVFDLLRMSTSDMHGDCRDPQKDRAMNGAQRNGRAGPDDMTAPPWTGASSAQATNGASTANLNGIGTRLRESEITNHLGQMLLTRAEPTKPLRLTIHTLALSLCLYVPALGAAMFAYTMLRDVFPVAAQAV